MAYRHSARALAAAAACALLVSCGQASVSDGLAEPEKSVSEPVVTPRQVLGQADAQSALDKVNGLSAEDRAKFDCATLPPASDFGGTYDVRAACEALKNPSAPAPAPDPVAVRAQAALDKVNALSPDERAKFDCATLPPASEFGGTYDVRAACAQLKAAEGSGASR